MNPLRYLLPCGLMINLAMRNLIASSCVASFHYAEISGIRSLLNARIDCPDKLIYLALV